MNVAFMYLLLSIISLTNAQLPFSPTATQLNDALVAGGCSGCTPIATCSTSNTAFSGGQFRCNFANEFVFIEINALVATDPTMANLVPLDTTAFLNGDVGSV